MHFVKFLTYDSEGSDFVDRISWTKEWKGMQTEWVRCSYFVVGCPLMDFVEAFLTGYPQFSLQNQTPWPSGGNWRGDKFGMISIGSRWIVSELCSYQLHSITVFYTCFYHVLPYVFLYYKQMSWDLCATKISMFGPHELGVKHHQNQRGPKR